MKLKVYGVNLDGIRRGIVAAKNKTEAAQLLGVTRHHLNAYGGETWNAEETSLAMSSPGTAWRRRDRGGELWEEIKSNAA